MFFLNTLGFFPIFLLNEVKNFGQAKWHVSENFVIPYFLRIIKGLAFVIVG